MPDYSGASLIARAREFAAMAHRHQTRKYTGEPYFVHCEEVALLLSKVGMRPEVVAAGYLHDTVEDCGVTRDQLVSEFGEAVATLVMEVTDVSKPSDGNRAARKGLDRDHLALASPEGMSVKLADLASNTRSITEHDPDFAAVYLREKAELMPLLAAGNAELHAMASRQLAGPSD